MTDNIKFLKVRDVKSPSRAYSTDAGIDFYVPEFTLEFVKILINKNPEIHITDKEILLIHGERILIPSGIHCNMDNNRKDGTCLIAFNKSGVTSKLGLIVGSCVVDKSYTGEIHLSLINTSNDVVSIIPGMKILQFIEIPIFTSEINIIENISIDDFYSGIQTSRGSDGFGSTSNI